MAGFWSTLLSWPAGRNIVNILNATAILYISGVAAAIGFRMNLFNIGVEGQYRVATFAAAAFAGAGVAAGQVQHHRRDPRRHAGRCPVGRHRGHPADHPGGQRGDLDDHAERDRRLARRLLPRPASGRAPATRGTPRRSPRGAGSAASRSSATAPPSSTGSRSSPSLVGVVFWLVLNRTRFGYDLRAAGASETAAVASGVNVKKMIVISMLLSGAVAGLIGMPTLFGEAHNYGSSFQTGHRLRRHRGGAAGSQQPDRDRVRRADLRVPHRAGQPAQHPRRRLARHHRGDPGRHRASRSSSPTRSYAATGSASSRPRSPPSSRQRRPRLPEPRGSRA